MAPVSYLGPCWLGSYHKAEPAIIRPGTEAHAIAMNFIRASLGLPPDDLSVMFARHADRMKEITDRAIWELHVKHNSGSLSPLPYPNEVDAWTVRRLLQEPGAHIRLW